MTEKEDRPLIADLGLRIAELKAWSNGAVEWWSGENWSIGVKSISALPWRDLESLFYSGENLHLSCWAKRLISNRSGPGI